MDKLKESSLKSLRFIERYTKTDMIYLAKGGLWLGLGQVVASGFALITSIAFANLLLPETYGMYKYILSINSLLLITTLSGMDSAVTQAIARGFDGTLQPAVKTKAKWGLIGSCAALGMAGYYLLQGNSTLAISFSILSFFIPFTESFDMYNSLLWGKKLFDVQTKYNIIKKSILVIGIVGTLLLTKNLYIILAVYFACITFPALFFFLRTKNFYQENKNIDLEAIPYGKNLSGIYIINLLATELDKILVFHYLGAINLAVYSLAVAPTDQIKGIMKNVNSLAMPQFSQKNSNEISQNLWRKIGLLGSITTIGVVAYITFAPALFNIFFPKYLSSVYYSQILSISLIPAVIAGFLYTILESQKAQSSLYKYNMYGNSFNILILFPLIYYYGIWGAVFSRILARLLFALYAAYSVKHL